MHRFPLVTSAPVFVGAVVFACLPALAQQPATPSVDPEIASMLASVSPVRLRADDAHLVGFGTRNLFSEKMVSTTRGVYAARDWLFARFSDIARTSGGRMAVDLDTFELRKTDRIPRDVEVSSVYATLTGDDPKRATYVISSHYDSRPSDGNDPSADAPGADDNGSGTVAVLEAARVMATRHFKGTIVFVCFDGEEQGLFGSAHFAKVLAERGTVVAADFNDDIVGASVGHGGEYAPSDVRLFSEALPSGADPRRVDVLGTENDSPSRELARAVKDVDAVYVPEMNVNPIYRADRFLRGGDQESFAENGFPAIRFVEQHENYDHQHQNVRIERNIQYGDLLRFVDFDYLARVVRLNIAGLATLATAPATPVVKMDAKQLAYDTTLSWDAVDGATSYEVVWRKTYEPEWTHAKDAGTATSVTLPLSKDDWLFGVRAVDASGHFSVAGFPTPVTR